MLSYVTYIPIDLHDLYEKILNRKLLYVWRFIWIASTPFFGVFTGTLHVACSCLLKLIYFVYLHFLSFVDEKKPWNLSITCEYWHI